MHHSYIGRQPIVDARGTLLAYDLSFPGPRQEHATETLVNIIHTTRGIDRFVGKRVGFIRIDSNFILNDLIHLLPKEKVVYSLVEDTVITPALAEEIDKLSKEGFTFALNDFEYSDEIMEQFSPILPYITYLRIDLSRSRKIKREEAASLQDKGLILIGTKIETHDLHAECLSRGFTYFQGFFISKPKILENDTFCARHTSVLKIWEMLRQDAPIDELVNAFEADHALSLKLIRFINSAAFSLKNPVSSIRHVLTLLGREPLSKWIMLLLFSEAQAKETNTAPLLLMVVNRTELMVKLLELIRPNASKSEKATAYFVGMLSLIHLLFNIPHREALRTLNVAPEIETACFEGDGLYGELLGMVRSIEMSDTEGMERFMNRYGLRFEGLEAIIADTMEMVNRFDEAMGN